MIHDRLGIITESTGAACALILAGFPLQHARLGKRGRTQFVFGPQGAEVYRRYLKVSQEVQATIARVKQDARRQEIPYGRNHS